MSYILPVNKYFIDLFLKLQKISLFINNRASFVVCFRVTGGELFEDIVAREFYSEADAR